MYIEGVGNLKCGTSAGEITAFTFDNMEYGFYRMVREKLGCVRCPVLEITGTRAKIVGICGGKLVSADIELTDKQYADIGKMISDIFTT